MKSNTAHVFPRHTHQHFGIGVITQGAQKSYSGRGMVEAGAGDTITVNPGEVHDGEPIGDASRAWNMLYLDPSLVSLATFDIGEGDTKTYEFTHPVISDVNITRLVRKLFVAATSDIRQGSALRGEELLLILFRAVLHEYFGSDQPHSIPGGVFKAKKLIDDNPVKQITLSDLARESGLSRFQVLRGFARLTGLTPHAYIVQCRINAARRLIARGIPLVEVALTCGFADQSHLTRIFVGRYGISPGAYAAVVNQI